jgi:hypothetical protein
MDATAHALEVGETRRQIGQTVRCPPSRRKHVHVHVKQLESGPIAVTNEYQIVTTD